jgi:hypothetical protein
MASYYQHETGFCMLKDGDEQNTKLNQAKEKMM